VERKYVFSRRSPLKLLSAVADDATLTRRSLIRLSTYENIALISGMMFCKTWVHASKVRDDELVILPVISGSERNMSNCVCKDLMSLSSGYRLAMSVI
jgi:hypothetical protein